MTIPFMVMFVLALFSIVAFGELKEDCPFYHVETGNFFEKKSYKYRMHIAISTLKSAFGF